MKGKRGRKGGERWGGISGLSARAQVWTSVTLVCGKGDSFQFVSVEKKKKRKGTKKNNNCISTAFCVEDQQNTQAAGRMEGGF